MNVEDVKFFLLSMDRSAGGGGCDYHNSIRTLCMNEALLTAEDQLVWTREQFPADCAARAIRTCQDTLHWYSRAAVVRAHIIYTDGDVD